MTGDNQDELVDVSFSGRIPMMSIGSPGGTLLMLTETSTSFGVVDLTRGEMDPGRERGARSERRCCILDRCAVP